MNKHLSRNAFTLVELLVVITIIGILAGIALPVFQKVQINAEQTKVLANAKQIGLACKLFAGDHDGSFPLYVDTDSTTTLVLAANANEAFGNLVPQYVPQERIFFVKNSKFTPAVPDENVSGTGSTNKLRSGENHFAYVAGLNDSSSGSWPLLADGFNTGTGPAAGASPVYINDKTLKGGVWEGNKAVVIRVDNSGSVATTNRATPTAPYIPRDDSRGDNLFSYAATTSGGNGPAWLSNDANCKILNPLDPP